MLGDARRRRRTPTRRASMCARVVVSSQAIDTVSRVDQPQVDPGLARRRRRTASARPGTRAVTVSKNGASATSTPPAAQAGGQDRRVAGARAARCESARPARGRPRTSTRSRRAAPARCRCWTSPSRGGCAARGSAARAGTPVRRRRRPTRRRAVRAAGAPARTASPGSPRAGHRSRAARRSAASCRRRCRRRTRPATSAGSARAGRRRRRRARRARAPPTRSDSRSRTTPDAPGYCTSTPNTSPSGSGSDRSCTTTFSPSGMRPRADDVERLREHVGVDDEGVTLLLRRGAPAPSPRPPRSTRPASTRRRPAAR